MTTTEAPTVDLADIDERLDRVRANFGRYARTAGSADLMAALDVAEVLREALDRAMYYSGPGECLEGDCDHLDEIDRDAGKHCPTLEVLVATGDEAIRLHRIRERLVNLGDLAQQTDIAELRDELGTLRSLADGTTDIDDI